MRAFLLCAVLAACGGAPSEPAAAPAAPAAASTADPASYSAVAAPTRM